MLRRPPPPRPDTDPQGPGETSSRSQVVQPVQPDRSSSRCTRPARTGGGRQSASRSMARMARSSSATLPRAGTSPADLLVAAGEDGHGAVVGAGDQRRDRLAGLPERLRAGLDRGPVAGPDDGHRAPHARVPVAADAAGGQLLRLVQQLGRGQRAAEQEQGGHGQQEPPPQDTAPAAPGHGGVGDGRLDGVPEPVDERDRAHRDTSIRRARRVRPRWTRPRAVPSVHPSLAAIVW